MNVMDGLLLDINKSLGGDSLIQLRKMISMEVDT